MPDVTLDDVRARASARFVTISRERALADAKADAAGASFSTKALLTRDWTPHERRRPTESCEHR